MENNDADQDQSKDTDPTQKPFRPYLIAEGAAHRQADGQATEQAQGADHAEVWTSTRGRVAVTQIQDNTRQATRAKPKTNAPMAYLGVFGVIVFFGLCMSGCALAVVVPYKFTMNWLGL